MTKHNQGKSSKQDDVAPKLETKPVSDASVDKPVREVKNSVQEAAATQVKETSTATVPVLTVLIKSRLRQSIPVQLCEDGRHYQQMVPPRNKGHLEVPKSHLTPQIQSLVNAKRITLS